MLLADVAGHGDSVSDLSAKLRKAMHKSINTVDQAKLARVLNKAFDEISGGAKFATALLMTYYAPSGHLIFVNAGHPPPLLCRAGSNTWTAIDQDAPDVLTQTTKDIRVGIKNLPLGIIRSTDYEQIAIEIHDGDQVYAYTDGYIEAQSQNGKLLGVEGFMTILSAVSQALPLERKGEMPTLVLEEIQRQGYELADDDHTMLTFLHNGQGKSKVGIPTLSNLLKNGFGLGHTDTVV